MWLGGINGVWMDEKMQVRFPALAKLGHDFSDFQNSQWRGEWEQTKRLTFGDIRDILLEVSALMKTATPCADQCEHHIDDGEFCEECHRDHAEAMADPENGNGE